MKNTQRLTDKLLMIREKDSQLPNWIVLSSFVSIFLLGLTLFFSNRIFQPPSPIPSVPVANILSVYGEIKIKRNGAWKTKLNRLRLGDLLKTGKNSLVMAKFIRSNNKVITLFPDSIGILTENGFNLKKGQFFEEGMGKPYSKDSPFTLKWPIQGAKIIGTGLKHPIPFQWKKNLRTKSSTTFQLAMDPDFKEILQSKKAETNFATKLSPGVYFWRVFSGKSYISDTRFFTVIEKPVFKLEAPVDNQSLSIRDTQDQIYVVWSNIHGTDQTAVPEVSINRNFSSLQNLSKVESWGSTAEGNPRFRSRLINPKTGKYYWRIRKNFTNIGPAGKKKKIFSSLVRSFELQSESKLKKPILIRPSTNSVMLSDETENRIIFEWTPINGAKGYELVIANDPALKNQIINIWASQPHWKGVVPIGGSLYWSARSALAAIPTTQDSHWAQANKLVVFKEARLKPGEPFDSAKEYVLQFSEEKGFDQSKTKTIRHTTAPPFLPDSRASLGKGYWRILAFGYTGKPIGVSLLKTNNFTNSAATFGSSTLFPPVIKEKNETIVPLIEFPVNGENLFGYYPAPVLLKFTAAENVQQHKITLFQITKLGERKKLFSETTSKTQISTPFELSSGSYQWQVAGIKNGKTTSQIQSNFYTNFAKSKKPAGP